MDLREFENAGGAPVSRHPWETVRADFILNLVARYVHGAPVHCLDMGCGDGWLAGRMLSILPKGSTIDAVDEAFKGREAGDGSIRFYSAVPVGGTYQAIFLWDVLEHIDDETETWRKLVGNHLQIGGRAFVSVPAHPWLFSAHDRWLGHRRRYTVNEFRRVLSIAGLEMIAEGGLFHGLIYPRALTVTAEKLVGWMGGEGGVSQWREGWHGPLIRWCLNRDWRAGEWLRRRGVRMPGLSHWAVLLKG